MAKKNKDQKAAILAYLFAPAIYFQKPTKKNEFIKFHERQGMNLFIIEISYLFASFVLISNITINKVCINYLYGVPFFCGKDNPLYLKLALALVGLLIVILIIIGIINVNNKETKELPIIGKLKIFK